MAKRNNLVGKEFGRLTVIKRSEPHICPSGQRKQMYLCKCSCGTELIVNYAHLVTGHTRSCGCYSREVVGKCNITHGLSRTRLFRVWGKMKARCYNPNNPHYKDYGGRGIVICEEWLDFQNFYDWAYANGYDENAPFGECTIDRIDNDKGYSPDNCRWVANIIQANNKRNNRIFTIDGITHTLPEWARLYGLDPKRVTSRLFAGWSIERALKTPVKHIVRTNRRIVIRGEIYTITQLQKLYGIGRSTIWWRLNRGWDIERALTTPTRRKQVVKAFGE